MLYHCGLLFEIWTLIICMHRMHNEKVRIDFWTINFSFVSMIILEIIYFFDFNNITSMVIYLTMIGYSFARFRENFSQAVITVILTIVIIATVQFVNAFVVNLSCISNVETRFFIINFITMLITFCVTRGLWMHKLLIAVRTLDHFIILSLVIIVMIVFAMLMESKMRGQMHWMFYVFVIPAIVLVLGLIVKWYMVIKERDCLKGELTVAKGENGKYDDLLLSIRMKEHNFKNHIAALFALSYTTKSYDELVFAQREYYGKIKEENKYVKLLYLGDSIVAGYLYEKFCDVERKNGHVEYDIRGQFSISEVPDYHLMEILGILIDNSVEAQDERPQLKFFFEERDNTLIFKILNPYPYIKYEEMNTWFDLEHSSKGAKHGLGLYYVKQICQKYRANIICRNVGCQGKNWIEMNLEIEKANR